MCRLLITSPIVPDVCKSMFELEPSAFKNGITDDETVLTVTVSVPELPVILIRPDESKFKVSEDESATTLVESFKLIVVKALAAVPPPISFIVPLSFI